MTRASPRSPLREALRAARVGDRLDAQPGHRSPGPPSGSVPEHAAGPAGSGVHVRDDTEDIVTAPPGSAGSFLHVDVVEHGTAAVVLLSGDLDLDSAPRLRAALDRVVAHGDHDVVVDVRELHFCGAVGLGLLVAAAQELPAGGLLTLVGASGMLRRLLHVTGVDRIVRVEPAAVSR